MYCFKESQWVVQRGLTLPPFTFLLVEETEERVANKFNVPVFHVIDAMNLGNVDVRREPYLKRIELTGQPHASLFTFHRIPGRFGASVDFAYFRVFQLRF
jgi:hypothetical protein